MKEAKSELEKITEKIGKIQNTKEWSNEQKQTEFTNFFNSLPDDNKFKEYIKDFDILSDSVDKLSEESLVNLYASQIKNTKGFVGARSAIKTYNAACEESTEKGKLVAQAIGQTNRNLGDHLTKCDGANTSMYKYGRSLVGVKAKTLALKGATTLLNTTLSMGVSLLVSWGISKLVDYFTDLAQAEEKAKEKLEETVEKKRRLKSI